MSNNLTASAPKKEGKEKEEEISWMSCRP